MIKGIQPLDKKIEFAKLVKKTRQEMGLSQAKFGELFGISATAIQGWEGKGVDPDKVKAAHIRKLAQIKGVSERDFLEELYGCSYREQVSVEEVLLKARSLSVTQKSQVILALVEDIEKFARASSNVYSDSIQKEAMSLRDFINQRLLSAGGIEALVTVMPLSDPKKIQLIRNFLSGESVELSQGNLSAIAFGLRSLGFDVNVETLMKQDCCCLTEQDH